MKKLCLVLSMGALSACALPPPTVTAYNESSVQIQQNTLQVAANPRHEMVVAEANRICGTSGRRAEYASSQVDTAANTATHLFLCLS
jgi:hypothetical protein